MHVIPDSLPHMMSFVLAKSMGDVDRAARHEEGTAADVRALEQVIVCPHTIVKRSSLISITTNACCSDASRGLQHVCGLFTCAPVEAKRSLH